MNSLFISHSSRQKKIALCVRDWLRDRGWKEVYLFFDPEQGTIGGTDWSTELEQAIRQCGAVLILLSPAWLDSRECRREMEIALREGKPILPVLVEETVRERLPEALACLHIIDMLGPEQQEMGFDMLHRGLRHAGVDPQTFAWPPTGDQARTPYRGMRSLESVDASLLFGRESLREECLAELRSMREHSYPRMLIIFGGSGAGKSSFLRAGLIAHLERDPENFHVLPVVRPDQAAMHGQTGLLAALGAGDSGDIEPVIEQLERSRAEVVEHFRRLRELGGEQGEGSAPTTILSLDQAEELFVAGNGPTAEEAVAAVALISELIERDERTIVIFTIRTTDVGRLQNAANLQGPRRNWFELQQLDIARYPEVVEGPGRLADPPITFEPALVDRLIADHGSGEALPLLSFTLAQLVERADSQQKITLSDYEDSLQGLTGVVDTTIERVLDSSMRQMGPTAPGREKLEEILCDTVLRCLVRFGSGMPSPVRRTALMNEEVPRNVHPLVRNLVEHRLLVSNVDADGRETVEVVHEAVFRHWTVLARLLEDRREDLSQADALERAALEWRDRRDTGYLVHRDEQLEAAESLAFARVFAQLLESYVTEYLDACREAQRFRERQKVRFRQVAGVAGATLLIASTWYVLSERAQARERSSSLARAADAQMQQEDFLRGTRFALLASRESLLAPAVQEASISLASNAQALALESTTPRTSAVLDARFLDRNDVVLTFEENGEISVRSGKTGEAMLPLMKHDGGLSGFQMSADEKSALSWSGNGTARMWDMESGKQVGRDMTHDGSVVGARFIDGGTRVLTYGSDSFVRVWDVSSGFQNSLSLQHEGRFSDSAGVSGAAASPESERIVSWNHQGGVNLWDAQSGERLARTGDETVDVLEAMFLRDGKRVIILSQIYGVQVWDTESGEIVGIDTEYQPSDMSYNFLGMKLSPDQSQILVWATEGASWTHDSDTGELVLPLMRHGGLLSGAKFSHDGSRVLSWSDFTDDVLLWNSETGHRHSDGTEGGQILGQAFDHGDGLAGATFSPSGDRVLSWDDRGLVKLWIADEFERLGPGFRHDAAVLGARFSDDGARVVTWDEKSIIRVWKTDLEAWSLPQLNLNGSTVVDEPVFLDDNRALVWGQSGTSAIWNLDSRDSTPAFRTLAKNGLVDGIDVSADRSHVLSWDSGGDIWLWGFEQGPEPIKSFRHVAQTRYQGDDHGAAFSSDGRQVVTWSTDQTVRVWSVTTGTMLGPAILHEAGVMGALLAEDGQRVLSWSDDGAVNIWKIANGEKITRTVRHDSASNDYRRFTLGARFLKDESRVLSWGGDGAMRIWDSNTGLELVPTLLHGARIEGVTLSLDEATAISWAYDQGQQKQIVRVWNVESGELALPPLEHPTFVKEAFFSPSGQLIVTIDGDVRLWDLDTGERVGPIFSHDAALSEGGNDEDIDGALLSADEQTLLTWAKRGTIRLWNIKTGSQLGLTMTQFDQVAGVRFLGDQKTVFSWSEQGAGRVWDVSWLLGNPKDPEYVRRLCAEKLNHKADTGEVGSSSFLFASRIDEIDTDIVPFLRGREGEDICSI